MGSSFVVEKDLKFILASAIQKEIQSCCDNFEVIARDNYYVFLIDYLGNQYEFYLKSNFD